MHLTSRTIIWLLVLMVIAIAGCNETTVEPVYNGRFHFPPNSEQARLAKQHGLTMPVLDAFNGVYPDRWPVGFELPPDTFLWAGTMVEIPARSGDPRFNLITVKGVAKGTPDELVEYFRAEFPSAGIEVQSDGGDFTRQMIGGQSQPGSHRFTAIDPGNDDMVEFGIIIIPYQGLGGYTFFGGNVTLKK